ncbi:MAG: KpsF/GutQ family sugar-phosphate isomerase [Phycisphaerales bacterium]|nr:KpsF/GutQ family sugar-phosphate isomerase [Phycisphaerales bacterium]
MTAQEEIIAIGKQTIIVEQKALEALSTFIDHSFVAAIECMLHSPGRLIISGIGKSAIIAQKIVATLNSTGTPALFLHAADAIHGDLGMVQNKDIVMLISKSGESPEIKFLVPFIRAMGNTIIGMVGDTNSYLAKQSTIVLNTTVNKEACPNNLAPTTSTTVQLAMGDALAVTLMTIKGFKKQDFAKYHPGGNLGKRLCLKVKDLYNKNGQPKVSGHDSLKKVIMEITQKRLGVTAVVNDKNEVMGIITDGDLRRMLEKTTHLDTLLAQDIQTNNPHTIEPESLALLALETMQSLHINHLLVTENKQYLGVIHLHDLIEEGI